MPATAAQKITLASASPPLSVTGLRGQTPPSPSGGFGGWTRVARPHRKALTQWDGIDPAGLTFSLIFDGSGEASVEADCLKLERLAQPPADRVAPPVVRVQGGLPHTDLNWVIDTLTWDGSPSFGPEGNRQRQEVTITLLEYVPADTVQDAATQARSAATPVSKTYTVKKGDTLLSIAAARLGDYTRWTAIAALNGLRDPNRLTVGQKLKLP